MAGESNEWTSAEDYGSKKSGVSTYARPSVVLRKARVKTSWERHVVVEIVKCRLSQD